MTPTASIVMLTYNNLKITQLCLDSLFQKNAGMDFELIVVDNASKDETPQFLSQFAEQHPGVQVVLNDINTGFPAGNNQGAALAAGEYLVFLNNDVVVTENWLSGLVHYLDNPEVGMVGPVTNSSGNESLIAVDYQDLKDMDDFARRYTAAHAGQAFEIEMLAFMCVVLRRSRFEEIGPLDERFGMGMFEDDDYALRIRQNGYRILCVEDVFIHHMGSASFSRLDRYDYWMNFINNRARFEEKWGQKWKPHLYRAELLPQKYMDLAEGAIWLTTQMSTDENQRELSKRIASLEESNSACLAELVEKNKALYSYQEQTEAWAGIISHLQQEANEKNEAITAYQKQIAAWQAVICEQQAQLDELRAKLAKIQSSWTWRLTHWK
jgi:GT2 family glycosyltransferase